MKTTKEKLSIDELARRMRNEWCCGRPYSVFEWKRGECVERESWQKASRLARKLFAQPAAEPRQEKTKPLVCEACGLPGDSWYPVGVHCTGDGTKLTECSICWGSVPSTKAHQMRQLRRRERDELARANAAAGMFRSSSERWKAGYHKLAQELEAKAANVAKKARK